MTDVIHLSIYLTVSKNVFYQLEESITKFSSTLNRDAEYLKTSRISRLPSYLAIQVSDLLISSVWLSSNTSYTTLSSNAHICQIHTSVSMQFVRFFYKEREGVNAKILKDVKFTLMLDVYDMCTPELQVLIRAITIQNTNSERHTNSEKQTEELTRTW